MNCLQSFSQCKICLAPAIHSNYGVISCSPCKMFFKRNAELEKRKFQCPFNGQCEININNRHMCTSCRINKCFSSGMQIELIRCSRNTKRKKQNQSRTLNLLKTNQLILTIDQYKIFSNLMISYDERNIILLAEQFISQQKILPIKFRFKFQSVHDFLITIFIKIKFLFEKNSYFHSLSIHDRFILIHHQMKYLILFSSSFIIQQSNLFDYPVFNKANEFFFGKIIFIKNPLFYFDIPYIKLSFAIISFSLFDYTIYDKTIRIENFRNRKSIIQIKDMYIELAWKYLISVYDEKKAMNCFLNLIQCILNLINDMMILCERKSFTDMVNIVIEQTKQMIIK